MTLDEEKAAFRKNAIKARAILAGAADENAAEALAENLRQLVAERGPGIAVSGFLAIGDEIDLSPALEAFHAAGLRCCLPVVLGRGRALIFRQWRPGLGLEKGQLGTRHPGPENAEVKPDVVLTPLLAYDADGHRIGWGGGFYDRTLASLRRHGEVLAVGVAYEGQRAEMVPRDRNDVALDYVVTEAAIHEIKPGGE